MLFLLFPLLLLLPLILAPSINASAPIVSIAAAKKLDTDPCASLAQAISNYGFTTVHKVTACYDVFPYDEGIASDTLRMIRTTLDFFYVFRETAVNPPDPKFQVAYNVDAALARLEKQHFPTDRAFHEAVTRTLIPLNDGHVYYSPSCYSTFSFYQPFFMTPILGPNGGSPRLLIHSVDLDFPDEFQEWAGAEVMSIDGKEPFAYLQRFADSHVGQSKDPHTRLARTTAYRYWDGGDYTYNRGAFSLRDSTPTTENITYSFKLPGDTKARQISVPWRAILTNVHKSDDADTPFTNAQTYHSRYCIAIPPGPSRLPYVHRTEADATASNVTSSNVFSGQQLEETKNQSTMGWPAPDSPVIKGPGFAFFLLEQKASAATLVISSFPATDRASWIHTILEGFSILEKYNIQRLILDLSNNEGGDTCLANYLIALLNPHPNPHILTIPAHPYQSNIRVSPLVEAIGRSMAIGGSQVHFLSPRSYLDPRTFQPFSDQNWLVGAKPLRYLRSKSSPYSRPLLDRCPSPFGSTIPPNRIAFFAQRPGGLVVLTNGYCGSACATLASYLAENKKARILVTTAIMSSDMIKSGYGSRTPLPTAWTFAGGQAISLSEMIFTLQAAKVPLPPQFPRLLPVSANFFFPFRQTISMANSDIPLEYIRRSADGIISITKDNVMQPHLIWRDVAISVAWLPPKQNAYMTA
ncbi:MAG: hypothetical protein DHS80DRAFT_23843 [Piptocephalis tieghemiana]|nr:MAG: hypothetical protein DHS80DRAFT_23843 [Piptocephalis tieghemiana]